VQLDLVRNELVFSKVQNGAAFRDALDRGKGLKYRRFGSNFYVSLEYFAVARQVLREFADDLRITMRYEKFAYLFVTKQVDIHIDWYPSQCKVSGRGMPWETIIPATRYFDKAALNSTAYDKGQWDGNTHLFNAIEGEFPSGLLERITYILTEQNIPFTIDRKFDYPKPTLDLHPTFEFEPTEDQIRAVHALNKANFGVAKLPTGFGKTSYVAADLVAKKGVRSLFLANQRVLINDAESDFRSVFRNDNVKIGVIGDGQFNPGDITVASIQGIVAALNKPTLAESTQACDDLAAAKAAFNAAQSPEMKAKYDKEVKRLLKKLKTIDARIARSNEILPYLQTVELFIVDEAQVLGTDMWDRFLRICQAPYRYTLSATPIRGDGGTIQIIAATGDMRFESSASEQIAKGRLAEFKGYFVGFDHCIPKELGQQIKIDFHQAYDIFIMNNRLRNEHLCKQVIKYAKEGHSVLALVTRIDHATIIQEILMEFGMPDWTMAIVTGDTAKGARKEIIENYREGKFPILIGSSIFDVGFNAKNASRMVRFNAGSSEVREPQRAGRTIRVREDGSHGETYDVLDKNVPYFESQSWKRWKLLREEFGDHRVTVLPQTIMGEMAISALRDVVKATADQTDREAGEAIIAQLTTVSQHGDIPEFNGFGSIAEDEDLKALLDELTMPDL
jgi:superfamily II DNA or RNA helicase